MSYQLPDLLTLLTTLGGDGDEGELHINPVHQSITNSSVAWLLTHLQHSGKFTTNKSRLRRTLHAFLNEYNPGLLIAAEWLGVCAILAEDTLRPHRIFDYEVSPWISDFGVTQHMVEWNDFYRDSALRCFVPRMQYFRSSNTEKQQELMRGFISAHLQPPLKPDPSDQLHSSMEEYLKWRVALSGHQVLAEEFLTPHRSAGSQRLLTITLEIIACVMDLFAYNVHQAWYRDQPHNPDNDRSHLNLVGFLQAGDPELTLQGAVNIAGDMIRERIAKLKEELTALRQSPSTAGLPNESGSIFAMLFPSSFSSSLDSSENLESRGSDVIRGDDRESIDGIRKTLLCWLTGTVHWAYEVDYFQPDAGSKSEQPSAAGTNAEEKKRRKRGSEIRDYGWVFLMKGEEAEGYANV